MRVLLGLPKTIYVNFKYFKFNDAIKFPILLSNKVYLKELKGKIVINSDIKFGMIKIGITNHMFTAINENCMISNSGTIFFYGKATLGNGAKIRNWGNLEFGDGFSSSGNLIIDCKDNVKFGENVLFGWNCCIMDTDNHNIFDINKEKLNSIKPINIGDRVWIGANSSILKGVTILNDTVIASHSVITKSILESNCVIGGLPNTVLRKNITWSK